MIKHTNQGVNLAKALAEQGYRIFTTETAKIVGSSLGIKEQYISECLHHLKQSNWITSLRRGIFALTSALLSGGIINEYEIAMAIADPAAISYWSALHYHQLTQQTPHNIFVLTTTNSLKLYKNTGTNRELVINGIRYNILSVKEEYYFGIKRVWLENVQINVTDLERTLLDAITKPKYCGGFAEVIESYKVASDKFDIAKLIEYANKLGDSAIRRLGWVLEYLGESDSTLTPLKKKFIGYIKLNASGDKKGKYNSKWGIVENI